MLWQCQPVECIHVHGQWSMRQRRCAQGENDSCQHSAEFDGWTYGHFTSRSTVCDEQAILN